MFQLNQHWYGGILAGTLALNPLPSLGSAFALIEQGVSGMGTAYASGAAAAKDANTIFFNPAGMTRLKGTHYEFAAHLVTLRAKFQDQGSLTLLGVPAGGGNGGNAGETRLVPNFYYSRQLSERWYSGLGINVPFGFATEYDFGWVGRYHAIDSSIRTLNINPSLAYKTTAKLSLGLGVSAQYIDAELTNAIDFGTILGIDPANPALDGHLKLSADAINLGVNLGLLYEVSPKTRFGLAWRSSISHTLEGDADFTVPASLQGIPIDDEVHLGENLFVDTGIEVDVELPDTVSASFYHDLNPRWSLLADATWTRWSNIDELRIQFDNPLQPDGVTTLGWDDTMRYALGVELHANERWTYRAGVAFDETPIPNAQLRTPRIPDEDRTWLALGLRYQRSQAFSLDLGYTHLFIPDPQINKRTSDSPENLFLGDLVGEYEASVDILSIQLNWKFL